jgi:hypothetical protein
MAPMAITTSNPTLSDDDARWLAVRTAASLSRLWARLKRFTCQPGRNPMRPFAIREVIPPEPWLDAVPPTTSFDGVLLAVQLAQGLLLLEATGTKPPDRRRMCLVVQHVSCSTTQWSANTLRLADAMGITLAAQPRDEPNATMHREIYALDGTYAEARSAAAAARPDVRTRSGGR